MPRGCRDNLRGFFEQCFPTLLKRLFGYDGPSWLNLVARVRTSRVAAAQGGQCAAMQQFVAHGPHTFMPSRRELVMPGTACNSPHVQSPKEADARALLKLLSPTGVLFTAMYSADADGATQFFFPKERLPTHTQVRGAGGSGCSWALAGLAGALCQAVVLKLSIVAQSAVLLLHINAPAKSVLLQMLLASPAGRAELERWPQYQRGAVVTDSAGRCHVKVREGGVGHACHLLCLEPEHAAFGPAWLDFIPPRPPPRPRLHRSWACSSSSSAGLRFT